MQLFTIDRTCCRYCMQNITPGLPSIGHFRGLTKDCSSWLKFGWFRGGEVSFSTHIITRIFITPLLAELKEACHVYRHFLLPNTTLALLYKKIVIFAFCAIYRSALFECLSYSCKWLIEFEINSISE